jgi:hypothetical protein
MSDPEIEELRERVRHQPDPRLQPTTAFQRFLPVHRADLKGRLRVDLTRSPHRLAMTAICGLLPSTASSSDGLNSPDCRPLAQARNLALGPIVVSNESGCSSTLRGVCVFSACAISSILPPTLLWAHRHADRRRRARGVPQRG